MTSQHRYNRVAITLHWLMALLLVAGFSLGLYMVSLKFSPQKLTLYSYHKWIGVTIFSLALLRVIWRMTHRPPPLPAAMPIWQVAASNATHTLLYVLLLIAPLSGWLYSSSAGVPTVPFGIAALQLPDLVDKDRELASTLKFVHMTLTYSFAALVGLHVAAVVKHTLIDKDGIIWRMIPRKTP
jgi:cytochrome b561